MDNSKMKHDCMSHDCHPPMGHTDHDHQAMMIADFRKKILRVLISVVPIMLPSTMICHLIKLIPNFFKFHHCPSN